MRPQVREFVRICSEVLPLIEPIVEIGARLPKGQEKIADLRPLFPGMRYIGCDMIEGPGVERVESLEKMTFSSGEVGTFLICDTLEHVRDLSNGIAELQRCLCGQKGILIATSVMSFPIHGYPNDYWRFTPEGFRELFKSFEMELSLFAGDPSFPHTVCIIAGKRELLECYRESLVNRLSQQRVYAPHYTDALSQLVIQTLTRDIVLSEKIEQYTQDAYFGFTEQLSQPGWVILPGTWIKATIKEQTDIIFFHLRTDNTLLMALQPSQINALTYCFGDICFQFYPSQVYSSQGLAYQSTSLYLDAITEDGKTKCIAKSPRGLLVNHTGLSSAFVLYESPLSEVVVSEADKGKELIKKLQKQKEKIVVDLGCGFRKNGNIGIDCRRLETSADIICLLGFEKIPLEDGVADEIFCRDFLEHIPKAVFLETQRKLYYPIMQLVDEIWRILKPGGIFTSYTPMYPHGEAFQDPTHLSAWTINSMNYFCGEHPGARRIYGIRACFEKIAVREEGFYLYAQLRKPQEDV